MAAQLNQIVAVEKGVKAKANRELTDVHRAAGKPELFAGLARTYQPRAEDGDRLPDERARVQLTVDQVNDAVAKALTPLFDVEATKDWANTKAKADVVVEGSTIIAGAPVPFLLFLEKQLADLRTYVGHLPILDPAETWEWDEGSGVWKTKPVETTKTRKVLQNHELAPATKEHKAQVQTFTTDEVVGDWTLIKFSGAIPATEREKLVDKVDKLLNAVKFAREQANNMEVEDIDVGAPIFEYLFVD